MKLSEVKTIAELKNFIDSTNEDTFPSWDRINEVANNNGWIVCDGHEWDICFNPKTKELLSLGECEESVIHQLTDADLADYIKKYGK